MKRVIPWVVAILAVSALIWECVWFFEHGLPIITSLVSGRFFQSEEALDESDQPKRRLTVNSEFNGTNQEFVITENEDDSKAILKIQQSIQYEYYNDNGDAVVTIRTEAFANNGEIFSYYRRTQAKNSDSRIKREERIYTFSYRPDEIYENLSVTSYAGDGSIIEENGPIETIYPRF
jgi:hypothetical protein